MAPRGETSAEWTTQTSMAREEECGVEIDNNDEGVEIPIDEEEEIALEVGSEVYDVVKLCLGENRPATITWGDLQALLKGRCFQVRVDTVQTLNGPRSEVVEILGVEP